MTANPNDSTGKEAPAKKKKLRLKKRIGRKVAMAIFPIAAEYYMRLYDWATLCQNSKRLTLIGCDEIISRVESHTTPSIVAFWHNRVPYGPSAYMSMHGQCAVIMISKSFDGDLIEATVKRFGNIRAVRGGSSKKADQDKGGQEALAEMIALSQQGYDLSITPDGPLGPRYQVKRGIIELAKATGLPIYPVACNSSRYFEINSWDRTRIPIPFSRVIYHGGPPLTVPADADEEMIESKRAELEKEMVELTEFADNYFK